MAPQRLPYVYKKRDAFYVRIVVPTDLRPFVEKQKGEISRLLGHSLKDVKANHARAVASALDERDQALARKAAAEGVEFARASRRYLAKNPDEIARQHYGEELALDQGSRLVANREAVGAPHLLAPYRLPILRRLAAGQMTNEEMAANVGWAIEEYRRRGNHTIEFATPEWRELAMKLGRVELEVAERIAERNEGIFEGVAKMPALVETNADIGPTITFDEIIDLKAAREAGGADAIGLPAATIRQFKNACRSFAGHRKSDNAVTVSFEEGEAWMDALRAEGRLKAKTMGVMLQAVRTVLQWGYDVRRAHFPPKNALLGLKLPKGQEVPPSDRTYTLREAKTVLTAAQSEKDPTLRFVSWIAAYSGARVSEISRLRPENFFQLGSDWFFEIRPETKGRTKTTSSMRRVPVHPDLVFHGLIDHVRSTKAGQRLFSTRAQPAISEWMHYTVKVVRDNLAPNHGFRHLFEDLCTESGMRDDARSYLTGRGTRSSRDKYGRSDAGLPGLARQMREVPSILAWDPTKQSKIE